MKITLVFLVLLLSTLAVAQDEPTSEPRFIVGITTKSLYVYDGNLEEKKKQLKTKDIDRANFEKKAISVNGEMKDGIPILAENRDEGLVQVVLKEYPDEKVWLETMALTIEPANRLSCPKVAESEDKVARSGMTIGFGDHCKPEAKKK